MKLKPPQFLVDVFRDLRDRRLLIPAGALLVALVAVPMLLSRSSSAPPIPPPANAEIAADASATQPAVLAETVTVRDYKRRLADLKEKNPFTEHFTLEPDDGGGLADTGLEEPPTSSPSGGGGTDTAGSDTADTGSTAPTTSSNPPSSSGSSGSNTPDIEARFYTWRVDVTVGPVGAAVERNGVKQLSLLPSKNTPVAVFLGITEGGGEAVFAVSSDAAVTDTTGSCEPSPGNCRYVVLKPGEGATLDYAPDGTNYRLALRKIHRVQIDGPSKVDDKL